jgi:hypothetical protein
VILPVKFNSVSPASSVIGSDASVIGKGDQHGL